MNSRETREKRLARLQRAQLYVLVSSARSGEQFTRQMRQLVEAGIHVLQLRDKTVDDRTLLDRARRLSELVRASETLFIVNDRPDIALLSDADGVHLGQDELPAADARTLLEQDRLIGVSTHCIEQARQAVAEGADYIGCGPTFPSTTKSFARFPGPPFLREVTREIRCPAFAIGGITPDNLPSVLETGCRRIAVSSAIAQAADPAEAARHLLWSIRNKEL